MIAGHRDRGSQFGNRARWGVVADLVLLGLGIALQPFRLSAFILILSSKDGTKKGAGFIAGWLACLVLVIAAVVLITGGRAVRLRTAPGTAVLIGKLALGIALIVIAIVQARTRSRPRILSVLTNRLDTMSPWTRLATLRTWLDAHGTQVIVVVCLVLGLWLTGESIHSLVTAGVGPSHH